MKLEASLPSLESDDDDDDSAAVLPIGRLLGGLVPLVTVSTLTERAFSSPALVWKRPHLLTTFLDSCVRISTEPGHGHTHTSIR